MSRKEIEELLKKARRSVAAAERLLRDGDTDFAVSRAYYEPILEFHPTLKH